MNQNPSDLPNASIRIFEIQTALDKHSSGEEISLEMLARLSDLRRCLLLGNNEDSQVILTSLGEEGFIARLFQDRRQRLRVDSGWVRGSDAKITSYDEDMGTITVELRFDGTALAIQEMEASRSTFLQ